MVIDIEKIEASKKGDKEMFAQVYDAVAPDLYKVALYTLGNPHDAEDVVSDTFIDAYKGISQLRDPAKFKFWIMKILSAKCKRKIAEYIRRKSQVDIEDFAAGFGEQPDLGADMTQRAEIVHALGRLSESERMIINLAVVQGYTIRETASIMGAPQGTVSSKLHRALGKMRKMLNADDV